MKIYVNCKVFKPSYCLLIMFATYCQGKINKDDKLHFK